MKIIKSYPSINLLFITFPVIALMLNSCKKLVEVDSPNTLVLAEQVYKSNETANSAISGLYAHMMDYGIIPYKIPFYTGLTGDEFENYSSAPTNQQLYKNQFIPKDSPTNAIWNQIYGFIYEANSVIEGASASSSINSMLKTQLVGEAKFIRAFWHFYLYNFYGDIPVIISTNYDLNAKAKRNSKDDVYKQIVADLKDAQSNLNSNYVDADGLTKSEERVRVNSFVATAMLAKVYLYLENYSSAEEEVTKVLSNTRDYGIIDLKDVFLKNNKEAIWQLMKPSPNLGNINTQEGASFILVTAPRVNGTNESTTLSDNLVSAFEKDDMRLVQWVGSYTDVSVTPNKNYLYPAKYKVKSGSILTEYTTVLRLGEQYLIRAEARARQNNLSGAIDDLDVIRKRAGLPLVKDVNPSISKDLLISAIIKEKRIELFTEWGNRWMDLKRLNLLNGVMSEIASQKGYTWNPISKLWPIPLSEIQNDQNLTQNDGYPN